MNTAQRIAETNRAAVFAMVGQLGTADVDDIAAGTFLAKDTVRAHLLALVEAGKIKRIRGRQEDEGGKKWAYRLVGEKK